MPTILPAPAAPDPDDRDGFVTEDQLRDLGIDPDAIRALAPHAAELTALDGSRCWCRADLASLLEGN
jgi:hypothetical protein